MAADALLGAAWVLFVWSVLGSIVKAVLALAGADDPLLSRVVAASAVVVVALLLAWGHLEAMRVPRVKALDVDIDGLGPGIDGMRVAPGRRADLTAFASDPVDTPPDDLVDVPVRLTVVGGRGGEGQRTQRRHRVPCRRHRRRDRRHP